VIDAQCTFCLGEDQEETSLYNVFLLHVPALLQNGKISFEPSFREVSSNGGVSSLGRLKNSGRFPISKN